MSSAVVEALRAQIRSRAPFIDREPGLPSGVEQLDGWIRGLPTGALTVVSGALGGGRARLVVRMLAARTQAGAPVAWVDGSQTLYPPALEREGVQLARLLVVRRADELAIYAYEQLLASGLFDLVVAADVDRWLTPPRLRRIQQAAEAGRKVALLITSPRTAASCSGAALKLAVKGHADEDALHIEVENDRRGWSRGRAGIISLSAPSETMRTQV